MLILEVIFALAFIYFLGSVIVSGINEAISMLFNKRGLELKRALILLLNGRDSDWGNRFFGHPQIEQIKEIPSSVSIRAFPQRVRNFILRRKTQVRFNPSYIAASQFADVMIEFIGKGPDGAMRQDPPSELSPEEVAFIGQMRRFVEASDRFNYKQFEILYLDGSQPEYPVLQQLRHVIAATPQDYESYRTALLAHLDQYVEQHATMDSKDTTLDHLKHRIVQLQDHPNYGAFQQFLSVSESLDDFKGKLEEWFNGYMDRVSGWYKRRMHITVFYIAGLVAVLGNIDSIEIIQNLIVNQNFRETVVAAAEQYIEDHPEGYAHAPTFEAQMDSIKQHISLTRSLFLPVGVETVEKFTITKAAGWLLTIFALSLGAPFWFDLLTRLSSLRASGKKPES
jgi:hypothetical protein